MRIPGNKTRSHVIINTICYLLIFLFVYTACSKLADLKAFRQVIGQTSFMKANAALISIAIPFSELFVSGLLLFDRSRMYGLWLSVILLVSFSAYILYMLLTMSELPCSCGGIISKLGWKGHIVFNSVFIFLALTGIFLGCYPDADRAATAAHNYRR